MTGDTAGAARSGRQPVGDSAREPGRAAGRFVVIGVGNTFRRDDGAGIAVARATHRLLATGVELLELDGEPARLLEAWDGAEAAFVVDAARTGAPPGTVHRFDATADRLPRWVPDGGTHGLGITAAVDLARTLDRLPLQLFVYGIEGSVFEDGPGLTPEVEAAVPHAATLLANEVEGLAPSASTAGRF